MCVLLRIAAGAFVLLPSLVGHAGANITDTRLWEKSGKQLFTVRSDNWNEKLGKVGADEMSASLQLEP